MWIGLTVFGTYLAMLFADEWKFDRKGVLSPRERKGHVLDSFLLAAMVGLVAFVEYSNLVKMVFGVLAVISIFSLVRREKDHAVRSDGREQMLHALTYMFYPIMLGTLAMIWPVIDGVSMIVGWVLPVSMKNLRPLCLGYFAVCAVFFLYRAIYWLKVRKHDGIAPEVLALTDGTVGPGHEPPKAA